MGPAPRRIALVDDDLDNYHANVFLGLLRGKMEDRGYAVSACTSLKEDAGRRWAEKNGIPWLSDPAEIDRRADCYMILAPSTSETHLPLCRRFLPFRKPAWIDKTFAPDLAAAREIYRLADESGTPVDTSSALRYTAARELARREGRDAFRHMIAWCPGGRLEEYLIHPLEMIVSCMGPEVVRVLRRGADREAQVLLDFSGGRTAVANVYLNTRTPYAASITTAEETRYLEVDTERLFADALAAVLDFFDRGTPTVDRRETLAIRAVMDIALGQPAESQPPGGAFIPLAS